MSLILDASERNHAQFESALLYRFTPWTMWDYFRRLD